MQAYAIAQENPFLSSEEQFEALKGRLQSTETVSMTHAQLENLILREGRELMRRLMQDHLSLRARQEREGRLDVPVVGADGARRTHRRPTERPLMTIFGPVRVPRLAYSARRTTSLHPLDAALNLPPELFSHGVRRRVAEEAAKTSFEETLASIQETTGAEIAKRQVEQLAVRAATDFDAFYGSRAPAREADAAATGPILVTSVDGKGVVMRKADLREATRKAAEARTHKLDKRLSKGEKKNSKRMATVAAVYTVQPFVRTPEQIVGELRATQDANEKARRPRPENKRVWASLVKEPEEVIAQAFEEADRRDPGRVKQWVALVDGNPTQIRLLRQRARKLGVKLTIILDIIHVLEYLWKAGLVFCKEGSKETEMWVNERFKEILRGRASHVAAGIRRSATLRELSAKARKPADTCAGYLIKHRHFLRYDLYLAAGLPIATGVIEGACRHLVKDRMDLTGARWSLRGAEAVLKLRSLRSSWDFDPYWLFHQQQELARNHAASYATEIPRICPPRARTIPPRLRRIK
jgi:hypothetical protein